MDKIKYRCSNILIKFADSNPWTTLRADGNGVKYDRPHKDELNLYNGSI